MSRARGRTHRFLGKMDANYARLKDLGAEVRDRDKRVALTTQMDASFRELANHHTMRSPDIEYHHLCADLLMGERNNQALNLYEFNQPAQCSSVNCTVIQRTVPRDGQRGYFKT